MYLLNKIPIALCGLALITPNLAVAAIDYLAIPLASGFDFPVGKPDSKGYYKARGFWPNGHLGEDWNGRGGGNTDLGDPVSAIGDGIVVLSRDLRMGWGNVVIIRHAFLDKSNKVKFIDSLYGHLNERTVVLNQRILKGQKIGTIGTNHGMYIAHLHFEIRKNISIGMHRSKFAKTYANYYSPTSFIRANRQCQTSQKLHPTPVNTFAPYPGGSPRAKFPRIASTILKKPSPRGDSKKIIPEVQNSVKPATPKPGLLRALTSPPRLTPKVQDIITEKKKPSLLNPAKPRKRIGLLSRLRSRFSKESKPRSNSRPRGLFPRR
ncbi:MAG: M23 family metallopeptidase [Verrucomicrobiaceae bacterium]|nr:M23 family metallopeptidase [Verrucomicrobiaceae bacterium]